MLCRLEQVQRAKDSGNILHDVLTEYLAGQQRPGSKQKPPNGRFGIWGVRAFCSGENQFITQLF